MHAKVESESIIKAGHKTRARNGLGSLVPGGQITGNLPEFWQYWSQNHGENRAWPFARAASWRARAIAAGTIPIAWPMASILIVGKQAQINALERMDAKYVLMLPSDHALQSTHACQFNFDGFSDKRRPIGCRADTVD